MGTTVRIPIPVGDQDPSFGVYAVPGLKTHVFVGPLASKTEVITETIDDDDEDDIVCLDEDPPVANTDKDNVEKREKEKGTREEVVANNELTNDDGDDDEISIIEPNPKVEEKKEKDARRQKRRLLAHNIKMLGQVPLVVTSQKNDEGDKEDDNNDKDDDIDIIGVVAPHSKETSQSKQLKIQAVKVARKNPLPYSNIPVSQFGKVVLRSAQTAEYKGTLVVVKIVVGEVEKSFNVFLDNSEKVILSHPNYPDHDVICPSLGAAK